MMKFEKVMEETLHRLDEEETRALLRGIETPANAARPAGRLRARMLRRLGVRESRGRSGALKWLLPLAACAALALVLLAIPGVSEAVSGWIAETLRIERYFYRREGERAANEDIDGMTFRGGVIEQENRVLLLPDTEDYAEVLSLRKAAGAPAYAAEDWAFLLDNEAPRISELFYDGVRLFTFTFIPCDPCNFMSGHVDAGLSELNLDVMTLHDARITAEDGAQWTLCQIGTGLTVHSDYWNAEGSGNREAMRRDGGVWLFTEYLLPDGAETLKPGRYTIEARHSILDGDVGEMALLGEVAVIEQRFVLDTEKALSAIEEAALPALRFSGEYELDIQGPDGQGGYASRRERVSFDGLEAALTAQRRATGLRIYIDYRMPADWDGRVADYIREGGGIGFELCIDGEPVGTLGASGNGERLWLEIALTESERARIQTLTLRPMLVNASAPDGGEPAWTPLPAEEIVVPLG
ncbi:MAG: hypothetical protein Q4C13_04535 [Clostridia bacterium]|nr:hypothetical protein [Clostridia bacterium]